MFEKEPTISVHMKRTVSLGNYESATLEVAIFNLPFDADEETIQQGLETGKITFDVLRQGLREKIAAIRREDVEVPGTPPRS